MAHVYLGAAGCMQNPLLKSGPNYSIGGGGRTGPLKGNLLQRARRTEVNAMR